MPIRDATNPLGLPTISDPIVQDRPCPRCSYNLKGLRTGDRCPECGTPIKRAARAQQATAISDVPIDYLRVMRIGAMLVCIGLPLGAIAMVVGIVMINSGTANADVFLIASLGFACWYAGVFLLHGDQPGAVEESRISDDGSRPRPAYWKWRLANRIIGAAPAVAMLMATAAIHLTSPITGATTSSQALAILAAVLALIGLLAFFSVCYYQAMIADWVGDSEMGYRFRTSPLVATVGGGIFGSAFCFILLEVLNWGTIAAFSMIGLAATGGITGYCVLGLVTSNLGFFGLFRWAIINRFTSMDIDRRLSAKINARIEENQSDEARKKAGKSIHF